MTTISNIDLHCHTTASDGGFSPTDVVKRAFGRGLNYLAITDHDLVAGVQEAVDAATALNQKLMVSAPDAPVETFIKPNAEVTKVDNGTLEREPYERSLCILPGVEFSTTWRDEQIHIVGLFIDIHNQGLLDLVANRRITRTERALAIGAKLERLGFERPYERCCERAQEGAVITRGNYARLIFEDGKAKSMDEAFHKYLRRGQEAYVKSVWGPIEETVDIIKKAGGIAVLAHPRRYKISNQRLRKLIYEFKSAGGEAMEVSSSQQKETDRAYLAELCNKFELYASLGSDFHNEGIHRDLGQNIDLPENLKYIWECPQGKDYTLTKDFKQRVVHITYKKEDKKAQEEATASSSN